MNCTPEDLYNPPGFVPIPNEWVNDVLDIFNAARNVVVENVQRQNLINLTLLINVDTRKDWRVVETESPKTVLGS